MTPATWLAVAQRIQAISQTGLAFAENHYDIGRYRELSEIAASMMAGPEPEHIALAAGVFASERGYATPKVDVRAAVLREDRLLLVRERSDGCWTLPGGWADVGQSAAECAEREVREESGYIVRATRLLACWDRDKHPHTPYPFSVYKLVFECELVGGAPAASDETSEVEFFPEDRIPELSRTRILPDQIRFVFDALRKPGMPAAFD
jgi:ADP-ribose pyrophosphatase YjhB (NUDIX family)